MRNFINKHWVLILAIAFIPVVNKRCGFLSRSTFYTSFKKVAGVSPKRYMKQEQRAIQSSEPIEYV